jgi:hypothetical protein
MIINKNAVLGGGIMTIYRLILVTFVAVIIFGISSVFYEPYIDVRDAEARIMVRDIVDCFTVGETVSLTAGNDLFSLCKLDIADVDRFFARVKVKDSEGNVLKIYYSGDSGSLWVKEFFDTSLSEEMGKFKPGYFHASYPVFVKNNSVVNAIIEVEVLVKDEF